MAQFTHPCGKDTDQLIQGFADSGPIERFRVRCALKELSAFSRAEASAQLVAAAALKAPASASVVDAIRIDRIADTARGATSARKVAQAAAARAREASAEASAAKAVAASAAAKAAAEVSAAEAAAQAADLADAAYLAAVAARQGGNP